MRSSLTVLIVVGVLACASSAPAQLALDNADIFIDTDGDGIAGPNMTVALNQSLSFYVWIDSKAYTWTNYQAWFTVSPFFSRDSMDTSADSLVSPGTNYLLDDFSNPTALGLGGIGFSKTGLQRIGKITTKAIQLAASFSACVTPIVDTGNAYGTFTIVATTSDYGLFTNGNNAASCYTIGGNATEATSWGKVKGLFQ
jgi:hypothetical protein